MEDRAKALVSGVQPGHAQVAAIRARIHVAFLSNYGDLKTDRLKVTVTEHHAEAPARLPD